MVLVLFTLSSSKMHGDSCTQKSENYVIGYFCDFVYSWFSIFNVKPYVFITRQKPSVNRKMFGLRYAFISIADYGKIFMFLKNCVRFLRVTCVFCVGEVW